MSQNIRAMYQGTTSVFIRDFCMGIKPSGEIVICVIYSLCNDAGCLHYSTVLEDFRTED